jgi:hypothetical protein
MSDVSMHSGFSPEMSDGESFSPSAANQRTIDFTREADKQAPSQDKIKAMKKANVNYGKARRQGPEALDAFKNNPEYLVYLDYKSLNRKNYIKL